MITRLKAAGRYVFGLRNFLGNPLSPEQCRRMISEQLRNREKTFLWLLEKGVFANVNSPYHRLLTHVGAELGDLAKCVRQDGVEATLQSLYRHGVYIKHDEFKCRRPIQRGSLSFAAKPRDFDNPLLARHYEASTGGSRGVGTRIIIDFDLLTYEAAYYDLFETSFGLQGRPLGMWHPLPPAVSGIKQALRIAKLGKRIDKWFSKNKFSPTANTAHYCLFAAYAIYGSRLSHNPLPTPKHVPLDRAAVVARWLAHKRAVEQPAVLLTGATSAVRICRAAQHEGLDISGTFFRVGAEPYTSAKARVIADAGGQAASHYSMAEIGNIGEPCASPLDLDDVHVLGDKLAIIQQEKPIEQSGLTAGALFYSTLLPSCPKIMLNVESGDYGILEERDCDCLLQQIGLGRHLRQIRSYDKLTSEGMTFLGGELLRLAEEVLPRQFGGSLTDYQFVEEEEEGIPKIQIRVSPRVGQINEREVLETVLRFLRSYPGAKKMMADRWREAGTLRVVRTEPCASSAGKILPLHILSGTSFR